MKKQKRSRRQTVSYELDPKDSSVHIRLSGKLLKAVKTKAVELGISYQKVIRKAMEDLINNNNC